MHGSVGEGAGTAGASRAEGRRRTEAACAGGSCRHRPLRLRRHFDQVLLLHKPVLGFCCSASNSRITGTLSHSANTAALCCAVHFLCSRTVRLVCMAGELTAASIPRAGNAISIPEFHYHSVSCRIGQICPHSRYSTISNIGCPKR